MDEVRVSFTDEELHIALDLWSLVDQARQDGRWPFDEREL